LKQVFGFRPVSFTVLDGVCISMIGMCEVVKADVNDIVSFLTVHAYNRRGQPVVSGYHLNGSYVVIEYLIFLCVNVAGQVDCTEQCYYSLGFCHKCGM
jgi:hypothetical protein